MVLDWHPPLSFPESTLCDCQGNRIRVLVRCHFIEELIIVIVMCWYWCLDQNSIVRQVAGSIRTGMCQSVQFSKLLWSYGTS